MKLSKKFQTVMDLKPAIYVPPEAHEGPVIGYFQGHWLMFESLVMARGVLPIQEHHRIYTDYKDLQVRNTRDTIVELGKKYDVHSVKALWAKLLLKAYNPLEKYSHLREMDGKVKMRKHRDINYRLVYNEEEMGFLELFESLCPQAQALVTIIKGMEGVLSEKFIIEAVNQNAELLHTKQPPIRIWKYYKGLLIRKGLLRYA